MQFSLVAVYNKCNRARCDICVLNLSVQWAMFIHWTSVLGMLMWIFHFKGNLNGCGASVVLTYGFKKHVGAFESWDTVSICSHLHMNAARSKNKSNTCSTTHLFKMAAYNIVLPTLKRNNVQSHSHLRP